MARRSSGSGCLIVVVGGLLLLGWIAEKLQNPETRTTWLAVGITIAVGLTGYAVLKRVLRKRYLTAKYNDPDVVRRIISGSVWQGQSEDQLRDSLGRPADVDEQVLKTKSKHVWKYGRTGKNRFRLRVTLENGAVVGWEEKG